MTPANKKLASVSAAVLALLAAAQVYLSGNPNAPPTPPAQAPAVTTWRDDVAHVTCWLANGPHGLGISCLRDAAGVFVP